MTTWLKARTKTETSSLSQVTTGGFTKYDHLADNRNDLIVPRKYWGFHKVGPLGINLNRNRLIFPRKYTNYDNWAGNRDKNRNVHAVS